MDLMHERGRPSEFQRCSHSPVGVWLQIGGSCEVMSINNRINRIRAHAYKPFDTWRKMMYFNIMK